MPSMITALHVCAAAAMADAFEDALLAPEEHTLNYILMTVVTTGEIVRLGLPGNGVNIY